MESTSHSGRSINPSIVKRKKSNLSARLDPNFDLKSLLPKNTRYKMDVELYRELNPLTMDFEELVSLLHPSFISDYLQKVFHFLKGDKTQLKFANLAQYKEAFLVKIAQNNELLKCDKFNEISRVAAKQVYEVANQNKDEFTWSYKYIGKKSYEKTLVYEKIYCRGNKAPTPMKTQGPSLPLTGKTSSMDSLTSKRHELTTSFKTDMLNTTLKFIKNDNLLNLHYPVMSLQQAEYIYALINPWEQNNDKISNSIGFGYKSIHSSVQEIMQRYSGEYEFKVKFEDTVDVHSTRIMFQKIPKVKSMADIQQSKGSTTKPVKSLSVTISNQAKGTKDPAQKAPFASVPEDFKERTVNTVADFVSDKTRASLEFTKLPSKEAKFVDYVASYCGRRSDVSVMPERCQPALSSIVDVCRGVEWTLEVLRTRDKLTRHRTLTMQKVPYGEKKKESPSKEEKSNNRPSRSKAITFETAGSQRSASTTSRERSAASTGRALSASGPRLNERKTKLIEAMSTPLESDKAARMMRMMGWEGGALGVRGEGITEPIMPALHLKSGAGLDYKKPCPITVSEFRHLVLECASGACAAGRAAKTVRDAVTRKQAGFARNAVAAFNERNMPALSSEQEKQQAKNILQELVKHPNWILDLRLSDDRREIILNVQECLKKGRKRKKQQPQTTEPEPQTIDTSESENAEYIVIDSLTADDQKLWVTRTAKSMAFRVMLLKKVLEFAKKDELEKSFIPSCLLNKKQRSFLEKLMVSVNKKAKCDYSSLLENELFNQIKVNAKDCLISIDFEERKFTLRKKFYTKRFRNSALNLPPPTSKDIKNTVFYIYNGNKDNDNKHDDNAQHNDNESNPVVVERPEPEPTLGKSEPEESRNDDETSDLMESADVTEETNDLMESADVTAETNDLIDAVKKPVETEESELEISQTRDSKEKQELTEEIDIELNTSCDISIDLDNESLLLESNENENVDDVKIENLSMDSDFENEIKVWQEITIDDDNKLNLDGILKKIQACNLKNENATVDCVASTAIPNHAVEINNNVNGSACVVNDEKAFLNIGDEVDSPSSKRSRSDSENSNRQCRKLKKVDVHCLCIEPNNGDKITIDLVKEILNLISKQISNSTFLPLLKYRGLKNNGLIYSCHNEKSLQWLRNLISVASDLNLKTTTVDIETECYKLKITMHSPDDIETIFHRLEAYNEDLKTFNWRVIDVDKQRDCIHIIVKVDEISFDFIKKSEFCLFAGVDQARFSTLYD